MIGIATDKGTIAYIAAYSPIASPHSVQISRRPDCGEELDILFRPRSDQIAGMSLTPIFNEVMVGKGERCGVCCGTLRSFRPNLFLCKTEGELPTNLFIDQ